MDEIMITYERHM